MPTGSRSAGRPLQGSAGYFTTIIARSTTNMDTISGATQLSVRLTKKELVDAHARLMQSPLVDDGSRYVPLERFGTYEVRLCQTLDQASEDVAQIWIARYAHDLHYTLDGPTLPRPTSFRAPRRHRSPACS